MVISGYTELTVAVTIELFGIITGRFVNECGEIGLMRNTSDEGNVIGPPEESE
jgi:hypothetical protein